MLTLSGKRTITLSPSLKLVPRLASAMPLDVRGFGERYSRPQSLPLLSCTNSPMTCDLQHEVPYLLNEPLFVLVHLHPRLELCLDGAVQIVETVGALGKHVEHPLAI